MNVLGLIPARGGSKSIPQKNIALLAGKPLLAYTCEAALASLRLNRVVLTTDDPAIAEVGRACGVEVPFMRPTALAQDNTPSLPVAQHAIEWLRDQQGWQTDILVLLQPTSPLRRAKHIDAALALLAEGDSDTVVSVVEVPHRYSPYSVMKRRGEYVVSFWQEPLPFDRFNRHEMPVFYARNGPAVLATRCEVLWEHNSFYGPRVRPLVMSEQDSIDIDTPLDLELAAWLLER